MTLSRRDRAALVLALECLRYSPAPLYRGQLEQDAECACTEAFDHLTARPYDGDRLALTLALCAGCGDLDRYEMRVTSLRRWRLLRARLALYLRAVLRADAIEQDDWWPAFDMRTRVVCAGCGDLLGGYARGETTTGPCPLTGKPEVARNAEPLWQRATATGTATRPAGLRRRS